MKVPFVGASYQMNARSFDYQRSINLYPLISESGTSKSVTALRGTPGLSILTTIDNSPGRGAITSTNNRAFIVNGNGFYELSTTGVATLRGTINTQVGLVSLSENFNQVIIVDGTDGWIFNKDTNTFTEITDIDFPVCKNVVYQDGYFIVTETNTQKFYISALNDGTSWDALDFTSVESSPDNLIGLVSDKGNLWLFGTQTTEIYQNTGNAAFPFERIPGAIIPTGCAASFTAQRFDNTVVWLGQDENGRAVVWRAEGYQAKRLSTSYRAHD
jgi:hypothetical protein